MCSHLADFLIIATVYFAATLECNYCSVHRAMYTLLQYTYVATCIIKTLNANINND